MYASYWCLAIYLGEHSAYSLKLGLRSYLVSDANQAHSSGEYEHSIPTHTHTLYWCDPRSRLALTVSLIVYCIWRCMCTYDFVFHSWWSFPSMNVCVNKINETIFAAHAGNKIIQQQNNFLSTSWFLNNIHKFQLHVTMYNVCRYSTLVKINQSFLLQVEGIMPTLVGSHLVSCWCGCMHVNVTITLWL